ncbi:MAG: pyridoxal phosphate-dependent aminotransferase [Planctomycetes bacterium]|nr:pyridoxal phosphate-dependent aminotransferase [Planctomycetota bacterium]
MAARPLVLARRMERLGTETAFEVLARARELERQGRSIVHLEIGEPDFDTPKHIIDAACDALRSGKTHYGPSTGLPELREAIAEDFTARRGVKVNADQVTVLAGGKPAIFFPFLALLEEGDEAIYPNPGFPIYESMIAFSGATPVPLPLLESNQFRTDVAELKKRITAKTKIVIINSPHNPCGSVLKPDDVKAIAELCAERGIWLFTDEIYCRILYDEKHATPLRWGDPDRIIVLDGFSKTFAMTGWRLGYSIAPPELAAKISKLQTNCNSCPATFSQIAAVAALKGPQGDVDAMVAEFRKRRDLVVKGLNELPGVSCIAPQGAFYAFANVQKTGIKARELQKALLDEAGVGTLAGTAFGAHGEGYIRLSYANSQANISEALRRMKQYLATKKPVAT